MPYPTIKEVDNYQVPELLIPRIANKYNYSIEFSTKLVQEAKRMLYIHAILESISPSIKVDDAWHEMLLFTKFYQDFCKFLGCGFIHHNPTPGPPDNGNKYRKTKENYKKVFKIEPDPKCWP